MKKSGGIKRFAISAAILVLIVFYSSFLAIDIYSGFTESDYSRVVRYLGILICVILVFVAGGDANNPTDLKQMKWAISFTALADFTMSMACNFPIFDFGFCTNFHKYNFVLGMLLFAVVQLILINRHRKNFKWRPLEIITGLLVFGLMIDKILRDIHIITDGGSTFKPVFIGVMAVYASLLCVSLWMAIGTLWRGYFPKQTAWLITIGMLLFFLCDNSLARSVLFPDHMPVEKKADFILATNTINTTEIQYIDDQVYVFTNTEGARKIEIPFTYKSIASILVWFFYLPAQVLLMLSTYNPDYLNSIFGIYPKIKGAAPPLLKSKGIRG